MNGSVRELASTLHRKTTRSAPCGVEMFRYIACHGDSLLYPTRSGPARILVLTPRPSYQLDLNRAIGG